MIIFIVERSPIICIKYFLRCLLHIIIIVKQLQFKGMKQ